jgi:hypothetical protein
MWVRCLITLRFANTPSTGGPHAPCAS